MNIPTEQRITLEARSLLARGLATAFIDPHLAGEDDFPDNAHLQLMGDVWHELSRECSVTLSELGLGELPPTRVDAAGLVRWLATPLAIRRQAWQDVFGLVISRQCPPYETEYCHWRDPTYCAQQMADIAGFYSAFGMTISPKQPVRQDHVALEIEFVAVLLQRQAAALEPLHDEHLQIARGATEAFLRDHVVWWMPTFARCLEHRIDTITTTSSLVHNPEALAALREVSIFTRGWLALERIAHGVAPSRQIIAPSVELPSIEPDSCGACGSVDSHVV